MWTWRRAMLDGASAAGPSASCASTTSPISPSRMADDIVALEFEKPIAELENKIEELRSCAASEQMDFSEEIHTLEDKCEQLKRQIYGNLTPWQRVLIARHPQRPYTLDYIKLICADFMELHGDRTFSDDPALVGGIATVDGQPVVVMGHQKGRTVQESMHRNFGMQHPEDDS